VPAAARAYVHLPDHDDDAPVIAGRAPRPASAGRPWAEPLLAAAACAAWANALGGPFQFDDYNVIVDNPRVHSLASWARSVGSGIRPLLNLSYTLNWVADPSPFGFHLVNVALHLMNTLLAYRLCLALGVGVTTALLAALLFGLHPIQTEAVTYVSGRSVSLMACAYLASVLAYVRGRRILSVVLFAFALAAKEVAVTMPLVLVLYEAATGPSDGWRRAWRRLMPHCLLLAVALIVGGASSRYRELLGVSVALRGPLENLATQLDALGYLVTRLVYPAALSIDPALAAAFPPRAPGMLMLLVVPATIGVASAMLRRGSVAALAGLWFFVLLLPTNSVLPRIDVVNERQVYLAALGPFLLLALGVERLHARRRWIGAIAFVLPATLAVMTWDRNREYRSEVALWRATVRVAPHNVRAWNNLGWAWQLAGCWPQAEAAYREALRLVPDQAGVRGNLRALNVERARTPVPPSCTAEP
jgi:protein O-mannosyl-transferase